MGGHTGEYLQLQTSVSTWKEISFQKDISAFERNFEGN